MDLLQYFFGDWAQMVLFGFALAWYLGTLLFDSIAKQKDSQTKRFVSFSSPKKTLIESFRFENEVNFDVVKHKKQIVEDPGAEQRNVVQNLKKSEPKQMNNVEKNMSVDKMKSKKYCGAIWWKFIMHHEILMPPKALRHDDERM